MHDTLTYVLFSDMALSRAPLSLSASALTCNSDTDDILAAILELKTSFQRLDYFLESQNTVSNKCS